MARPAGSGFGGEVFGPPFEPAELASLHHAVAELCDRCHQPARHDGKKSVNALD
jgi:hypothetical protein